MSASGGETYEIRMPTSGTLLSYKPKIVLRLRGSHGGSVGALSLQVCEHVSTAASMHKHARVQPTCAYSYLCYPDSST